MNASEQQRDDMLPLHGDDIAFFGTSLRTATLLSDVPSILPENCGSSDTLTSEEDGGGTVSLKHFA